MNSFTLNQPEEYMRTIKNSLKNKKNEELETKQEYDSSQLG